MKIETEQTLVTVVEHGSIITPKGFKAAGLHSGVKKAGKLDLGVIYCEVPASSAAVYTLNKVQAAPIKVTKESIGTEGKLQAVIVNSGNANACTGKKGIEDAFSMRSVTAKEFQIPEHYVAVASTGVIGELIQLDKITNGINKIKQLTETNSDAAQQFNEAILTTDTINKKACFQTTIDGKLVTFGGVAKGSGMIHPNMATMLGFLTTDANIEPKDLQFALSEVIDETFNRITVDGDTSTNDTVIIMASSLANNDTLTKDHPEWNKFILGLKKTCEELAKKIARDGEGATKLIEVQVQGAVNDIEAGKVAKTIVGSDLVKTAIFGTDANWGRIICAIGYSGAEINPETVDISIGEIQTLQNSTPLSFSEEEAKKYLSNEMIVIKVDLKVGEGAGVAWGCDLTYDYVKINAGYRS